MFYEASVEIHHHKPVEASIYIDVLTYLELNAKRAYESYLYNLRKAASPEDQKIIDKAIEIFNEDELSWFWIETTEPGSGKAKGKGRNTAIIALWAALGFFAKDVIDETKIYVEMKEKAVHAVDAGYDHLKEYFEHENENYSMICKKEKDRIIIEVKIHPFREERYEMEEEKYPKA